MARACETSRVAKYMFVENSSQRQKQSGGASSSAGSLTNEMDSTVKQSKQRRRLTPSIMMTVMVRGLVNIVSIKPATISVLATSSCSSSGSVEIVGRKLGSFPNASRMCFLLCGSRRPRSDTSSHHSTAPATLSLSSTPRNRSISQSLTDSGEPSTSVIKYVSKILDRSSFGRSSNVDTRSGRAAIADDSASPLSLTSPACR
mmetsp:Transcript_554/g.1398  ORF Transcript_554/g.1398 Transcript_554/m.1398 type:complete len:202 (+) Transcript_554:1169-1774(+)